MKSFFSVKKDNIIDTPHKNNFNFMSIAPALNTHQERKNILSPLKNTKNVVIGSFAFNKQQSLTIHQKRPLTDIDIKSNKPKHTALKIERNLDRNVGFNNYYVSVLKHDEGTTYRVHSRARNQVVADVSHKKKFIPFTTINDIKYETLAHRKKEVKKMLNKPSASYRRDKDKKMMGFIKRAENYDIDGDGVVNGLDCAPYDKNRQGYFHEQSERWADNIKHRHREESIESKISSGVAMGMRKSLSMRPPQNYHLSKDRIDDEEELRRRVIEVRIQELVEHGLTVTEASSIAEKELLGEHGNFAHSQFTGGILWQKYRPVTMEQSFSHFPYRNSRQWKHE
jgi:hypothetical protein